MKIVGRIIFELLKTVLFKFTEILFVPSIDFETFMTEGPEKEQKFVIFQELNVKFSESINSNKIPKILSSSPK